MVSDLRVTLLINSLSYGGAEHLLVDLVNAAGDRVDFEVAYFGGGEALVPELESAGASVRSFDESTRFDPRALLRCVRYVHRRNPDVVHAHLPYAQTIGRLAAATAPETAVVSTQHNVPSNYHPVTRASERVTRRIDSVTVAVSQGVERAFTGDAHPPNDLGGDWCTIYNGIDITGFEEGVAGADTEKLREHLGIDTERTVFLSVGRYVQVKSQQDIVRAFARAELDGAELVLVGHGPLESTLRDTARENDVSERVHVTGQVPDTEPYYAIADVFVSASRREGLPVTILEAMTARLPVVGTAIPGVDEVVLDGETGLLSAHGDTAALAEHMERSLSTEFQSEFGAAGYRRVQEQFSVETMADTYVSLYRTVSRPG